MPKTEIHLHLEGAIPIGTLWELIEEHGGDASITSERELRSWFTYRDFRHFLDVWTWMTGFLRSPRDFELVAEAVARRLVDQNILYVEAFFSPSDFGRHGLLPQQIALAIRRGLARVDGVDVALIADLVRDRGPGGTAETLRAVEEVAREAGIIGIGIGGSEAAYPPGQFASVYRRARAAGLRVTAHAGENDGPAGVWGAIRDLEVERIGHGIRSVEDPALVAYLVDEQLPLEVCPTSNLRTGVVTAWEQHPARVLIDAGAHVTINTDDPAMFGVDLAEEYRNLQDHFGLDDDAVRRIALAGIEATWADEATRQRLTAAIEGWWAAEATTTRTAPG